MYEQSGRYDEPLDATFKPPKSGLATKYRATKAPTKRPESAPESDVSFGWIEDLDIGKSRKENPAGIQQDLGKSRQGELKNWTGLEATYRESREDVTSRATYDNNMVRSKPPLGNTRRSEGLSRKPPSGPSGPRTPREKIPRESRLHRDTVESRDMHESRDESWGGWQQMALNKPGENGEGWGTIFRGMQLRWSDRQQRKNAKPPGSLTIEDQRSRDGSSRSESIMDEETRRKRRTRILTALAILVIIFVIAIAVVIPVVMLTMKDDKVVMPKPLTVFEYKVRSTPDRVYDQNMNDPTSNIFIQTAGDFCNGMEERFGTSNLAGRYRACEVTELRNGSVIFVFLLTISGTNITSAQINTVITGSTTGTNDTFVLGTITLNLESLEFLSSEVVNAVNLTNVYCIAVESFDNGNITYSGYQYSDTATVTCSTGYALQGESTINCTRRYQWSSLPNCTLVVCANYTIPNNSSVLPTNIDNREYNTTLTITCDEGFNINGLDKVTCMEDGNWSVSPTCNITLCPNITLPNNSQLEPQMPPLTYTSMYRVICDEGYIISEDINVTCLSNGSWSKQPSCEIIACMNFTIPDNSTITPASTSGYVYNDTIVVKCDPGYDIVGSSTVTCMSNSSWSDSPTCSIKNCPNISTPNNGQLDPETPDTVFGSSFELSCDEGFELQGNGSVECLANGTWSASPTCSIVTCEDFPSTDNGKTLPANTSGLQYNSSIEVICDDGYSLSKNDSIRCQLNKTWSMVPTCNPVPCTDYVIPANASIRGNGAVNGNVYLDTLSIECVDGFNLEGNTEVECQANGSWTESPNCNIVVCDDYVIPVNSVIEPNMTTNRTFGTILSVSCLEGYEINGNKNVTCQANGSWSSSPECKIIACNNFTSPENGNTKPQHTFGLPFGSTVNVTCDGGFELKGEETVRCLANKSWSSNPTCDAIDCDVFTYPNNSVQRDNNMLSENSKQFNQKVNVTCNEGYVLIGQKSFSCNETGNWPDIECKEEDCNQTEIDKPNLLIATVANDVYTLECESGYTLQGNDTVSCIQGNWTVIPNCTIVDCGDLTTPENGTVTYDTTYFRSIADLSCDNGFEGNRQFECLANGSWSGMPLCNPVICKDFLVMNGSVSSNWSSPYVFSNEISINCEDGFELTGDESLTCQADREWSSNSTCDPIECEGTIDIDNAVLSPNKTSNLKFGEIVMVGCHPGYEVNGSSSVKCQADGTLSREPNCDKIHCPEFSFPQNAVFGNPETLFGEEVVITCEAGFKLLGEATSICQANKTWSPVGKCEPIQCLNLTLPTDLVSVNSSSTVLAGYFYGEIVGITCQNEKLLIGENQLTCNPSGNWSVQSECQQINCNISSFNKPENSRVVEANTSALKLECDEGYDISSSEAVLCANGSWGVSPNCTPVNCGELKSPSNGVISSSGTTYSQTANLTCDKGYEAENSEVFACLASGDWNDTAVCNIVNCPELSPPEDGLIVNNNTNRTFGDSVSIACNVGYNLTSDGTILCQANKTWSGNPKCEIIKCDDDPIIGNGNIDFNTISRQYMAEINISCVAGYEIEPNSKITCEGNGSWTGVKDCEKVNCSIPDLPDKVSEIEIADTLFEAKYNISCVEGYELNGDTLIECTAFGNWSVIPGCRPVDCGNYSIPVNALVTESTGTTLNETVMFECQTGYNLNGSSVITCQADASWTKGPECNIVDCGALGIISNGNYDKDAKTTFNETVAIECNLGYELVEENVTTCLANGNWTKLPECVRVKCNNFTVPENGFVKSNETLNEFEDIIEIGCDVGYNLSSNGTILCQANKTWSGNPKCEIIKCDDDPIIGNGNIDFNTISRQYMAEINISCVAGYEIEPNSKITCEGNGSWTGVKDCEKVNCSIPDLPDKASEIEIADTLFEAKYNISCVEGYELNGDTLIECTAFGNWSVIPGCRPVDCGNYSIPVNALVTESTGKTLNETVIFKCQTGYSLNGSSVITCQADASWTKGPECNIVDCGALGIISNGNYDKNAKTTFNETVAIDCDMGYEFVDESVTTCQANGNWTKLPECVRVKCNDFTVPENGFIKSNVTLNEFEGVIEIGCDLGYNLSSNGTILCQANKTWSGSPACEIVTCDADPDIANGFINATNDDRIYNSTMPILCNEGYEIEINSHVKCEANGSWVGAKNCTLVDCGQFNETIANGTIANSTGTSYSDEVYIDCDAGFIVIGDNPISCQQNGTWERPPYCQEIDCVDPNITSSSSYKKINATFYEVTCDEGHVLIGSKLIECRNEGWDELPTCEERNCSDYTRVITNGKIIATTGTRYGDTITFACDEGFLMNGTEVIICDENGDWEQQPTCQPIDCGMPEDPENGHLFADSPTIYNTTLAAECNEGYTLDGESGITCQESGNWSQGVVCNPINCGQLEVGGVYKNLTFTNGSNYGSVATVECEDGYRLIGESSVNCTANGWSALMICSSIGNVTFDQSKYEFKTNSVGLLSCTIENAENWTTVLLQTMDNGQTIASINRTSDGTSNSTSSDRYRFTDNVQLSQNDAIMEVEISSVQCEDAGSYLCGVAISLGETQDINFDETEVTVQPAEAAIPTLTYVPPYTVTCEGLLGVNDSGHVVDTLQLLAKKQDETTFAILVSEQENVTSGDCRYVGILNYTFPSNESWDQAEVKCVTVNESGTLESNVTQLDFPAPTCEEVLDIDFGSAINVTSDDETLLTVECDEGYENLGDVNITCTASGWMGTPNCSLIDCGTLLNDSFIIFEPTNMSTTTYGSRIFGYCEQGYLPQQIFGSDNYAICEETGDWNISFSCEMVNCGNYTVPSEGRISFTNGTTYNSVVEIECTDGFNLEGNDTFVCDSSGMWIPVGGNQGDPSPTCTVIGGLSVDSKSFITNVGGNFTITCSLTNTPEWSTVAVFHEMDQGPQTLAQIDQTSPGVFSQTPSEGVDILNSSIFSNNSATFSVRINNASCSSDGNYYCGAIKGNLSDPSDTNSLTDEAVVTVVSDPGQPTLDTFNTNLNTNDVVTLTCRGNVGQQSDGDPIGEIDVQIMFNSNSSFQILTADVEANATKTDCLIEHVKSVNVTIDSSYDGAVVRCVNEGNGTTLVSENVTLNITGANEVVFELQSVSEGGTFTAEMRDTNSQVFNEVQDDFCSGIEGKLTSDFAVGQCNLVGLSEGSIIFTYTLTYPETTVVTEAGLITALSANADNSSNVQIGTYSISVSSIQVTTVTITKDQVSVLFGTTDPTFTIGEENSLNITIQGATNWNTISIFRTRDGIRTSFANITNSSSQFAASNVVLSADSAFNDDGAQVTIDFKPVECQDDGSYDLELSSDGGGTLDVTSEVTSEYSPKVKLTLPVEMKEDFWALGISCDVSFHEADASEITWLMKRNDESAFTAFNPADIVEKDVEFRNHNVTAVDGLPCLQETQQDFDLNTTDAPAWNNSEFRCALGYGTSNEVLSDIGVLRIIPRSVCANIDAGQSVQNPLECTKRVLCRDDSVVWSYVYPTSCEEGTCWVGPSDSDCAAVTTTTTTTTTTPAPGTPYISCMDTEQTAQRDAIVTFTCELRDIESVSILNISRDGVQLYYNEDETNGISGTFNADDGVTVVIGEGHLNISVETNCDTEGMYKIEINNVTDDEVSLELIEDVGIPELTLPSTIYMNQKTDITCTGNVGRAANGEGKAKLSLEIRKRDMQTFEPLDGVTEEENTDPDCVITGMANISMYFAEEFNHSSVRCVAKTDDTELFSEIKNVTLLQPSIFFAVTTISRYIGDWFSLDCNIRNTINVARVSLLKDNVEVASIDADNTTSNQQDVEVLDTSAVSPGTSRLVVKFTNPLCSNKGDYFCEVTMTNNATIRAKATVSMKRQPSTPILVPSLQIIEGVAPWAGFETKCTAEVGYPSGTLSLETNKDGGVFSELDTDVEYSVDDETCSTTASLKYFNTYTMSWDDTTMKCVASNDAIEDVEVEVAVLKQINVVPASFCDDKDTNTGHPHPYYCYGRLTCTESSIEPYDFCDNSSLCYNWDTQTCFSCETTNQCDVGSTIAPSVLPGTPFLNCTSEVKGRKNEIVMIQCDVVNMNITLADLTSTRKVTIISSNSGTVFDTTTAQAVTTTGEVRVFVDGSIEARITETSIEIDVNLTECGNAGTYSIQYEGDTVLQDDTLLLLNADAEAPTYSQRPTRFYEGQSVNVTCRGNIGGPGDSAGTLALVVQSSGSSDWTVRAGGVSETANDEETCGTIETITYSIPISAEINGSKFACRTTNSDGQNFISDETDVLVAQAVLDFGQAVTVAIGSNLTVECTWDNSITSASANIRRRTRATGNEETVVSYTSGGAVTSHVDGISGEFQQSNQNTLSVTFTEIGCGDEAEYVCGLIVDGETISEEKKDISVTRLPDIPELKLPRTLVLGEPTGFTDYLSCGGMTGYPARQLRIEYTKPTEQSATEFSLGTKSIDVSNFDNCSSTATHSVRTITFDSSWNNTVFKCVVFDGEKIETESPPQSLQLLENNCSSDNNNQYFVHPYNCHFYYLCYNSGTLAVNSCGTGCPSIENGALLSCTADCNC